MKYDFTGIVFHEIIIMKFMSIHPIEYKIRSLARSVQAVRGMREIHHSGYNLDEICIVY